MSEDRSGVRDPPREDPNRVGPIEVQLKQAADKFAEAKTGLLRIPPARACHCIGPQPGMPRCPCLMAGLVQRKGRWIQPEVDLGPVTR
jgi:hypothetical protein